MLHKQKSSRKHYSIKSFPLKADIQLFIWRLIDQEYEFQIPTDILNIWMSLCKLKQTKKKAEHPYI